MSTGVVLNEFNIGGEDEGGRRVGWGVGKTFRKPDRSVNSLSSWSPRSLTHTPPLLPHPYVSLFLAALIIEVIIEKLFNA